MLIASLTFNFVAHSAVSLHYKRKETFAHAVKTQKILIQIFTFSTFFKQKIFHPGYINLFENNTISFYLPENSLYDSIRFRYNEINTNTGFTIYQLHNLNVPVQVNFPIKIKRKDNFVFTLKTPRAKVTGSPKKGTQAKKAV